MRVAVHVGFGPYYSRRIWAIVGWVDWGGLVRDHSRQSASELFIFVNSYAAAGWWRRRLQTPHHLSELTWGQLLSAEENGTFAVENRTNGLHIVAADAATVLSEVYAPDARTERERWLRTRQPFGGY